MSLPHAAPQQNLLLASLSAAEFLRLEAELEAVTLTPGQVIFEAGDTAGFLYFPTAGVVSLIWTTADGAMSELAVTGHEGLIGLPAILGGEAMTHRAVSDSTGHAYRIRSEIARWVFDLGGELPLQLHLYAQNLLSQIAQNALCSRHHSVEQQLCRCLLVRFDLLGGKPLDMTQAALADRLGLRRVAVSAAAAGLQRDGLIAYRRGRITVLDRDRLRNRACGCYAAMRREEDKHRTMRPKAVRAPQLCSCPKKTTLRSRAEFRLAQRMEPTPIHSADAQRLIHELQVHQIELELQNEELTCAWTQANAERERAADVYDFAPVAYVTVDALGVIRQINLSGLILLGITHSHINRHRFVDSVSTQHTRMFSQFVAAVLKGRNRKNCEIELTATPRRELAIVRIEAIANDNGQECRMVLSDITEQRRVERALQEEKEFFHLIAENIGDFIAVLDRDGRRLYNSPSYFRFLGMPADLRGTDSLEDVHPDDRIRVKTAFSHTVDTGLGQHLNYRLILPDGSCRDMESTGNAITDEQGRVQRVVVVSHDVTDRKTAQELIERYAFYDSLTQLPNRRLLIDRLAQSMVLSARSRSYGATMFLDLDHFKSLNDEHGHAAGDALLVQVADRLRACVREVDTVSRFGGDEFVVLISEINTEKEAATAQAMLIAEKIRDALATPYGLSVQRPGGQALAIQWNCTATIGVVLFLNHEASQDEVLKQADRAMYLAKESGRNQVCRFT